MFDHIFGNYLVDKGQLTKEQLEDVICLESQLKITSEVAARSTRLLTDSQIKEIRMQQHNQDDPLLDIAREKGYLSARQVDLLNKKKNNLYMAFIQAVLDLGYMEFDDLDKALVDYQQELKLRDEQMDDLVSGDPNRMVKFFLPGGDEINGRLSAIAVRTLIRIINDSTYVSKAFMTDEITFDNCAIQKMVGDFNITTGFAGRGKSLLAIADSFAEEEFEKVDEDALDAVAEFANCINGLFASELSREDIDLDMLPPEYYEKRITLVGKQFCVFPILINDVEFNMILSVGEDITIKEA